MLHISASLGKEGPDTMAHTNLSLWETETGELL